MTDTPTFKQQLEKLEGIVRQLEDEDLDLDRAIELFEGGIQALRKARTMLNESEVKVQKVIKDAGTLIREEDVDL